MMNKLFQSIMSSFDSLNPNTQHFDDHSFAPPPKKRGRKWKWLIVLCFLAAAGFGVSKILTKTNKIFDSKKNIFQRITGLFVSPDKPLVGEEEGTVNILLLGVGGNGHDGAYLTDTMIVASINTKTNEVVMTNIPRDFALTLPKYGYNKINAAYAYTYRDDPADAGAAAIAAAEQVTGFKIPYYAVIDFKGFVRAVDDVGGLDVEVAHTFTDSEFPNDYPYDTKGYIASVSFTKGPQHMSGVRALIFARSRHSDNPEEGSDFARSERQKKILVAFKAKITDLNLTQLNTVNNLLNDFTDNFRTNLEPYELAHLASLAKNINSDDVYSFSLEPQDNLICSALVDPTTGKRIPETPIEVPTPTTTNTTTKNPTTSTPTTGKTTLILPANPPPAATVPEVTRMYVVQACEGKTLADIQKYLTNATTLAKLKKEGAAIEIQTSLGKPITGTQFAKLADAGLNVRYQIFKGKVAYDQTILYDNSHGGKPHSMQFLAENYHFTSSDVTYPASAADFVLILGKDWSQ